MNKKYFPIQTDTSCLLKWSWTTLFLNSGISKTCHRTSIHPLTAENFNNFHNNATVLEDRKQMLRGSWPESNCSYCRNIEQDQGVSDRMVQKTMSDLVPVELETDSSAIVVTPTIVEVYFNNVCNLGCLYCSPLLSSTIDVENRRHGIFDQHEVKLQPLDGHFKDLVPYFWEWFDTGFSSLKRLHVLGGEPFYQKEFDKLLDKIEEQGNPDCILNVVTNLMLDQTRLKNYVEKFKKLLVSRKLKRIDITCSIDCWGVEQEYVRWGLNLAQWEQNFDYLLSQKWLTIHINQTISALTIKTMPDLLVKLKSWREKRPVGHWFSGIAPGPSYMKAEIFGNTEFQETYNQILSLMPNETDENKKIKSYMAGIIKQFENSKFNINEIKKLIIYLDEKDRRRGTDWKIVFPWLKEYQNYVV